MKTVELPITELPPYDVVVVAGGTAGFPAAVAAAREGAKVLLGLDATDSRSLTDGEKAASEEILALVDFIRRNIPGFEQAYLLDVGRSLAIRESRRVLGDYVLTVEDIQQRRSFYDGVALGSHFIDIHPVADASWETRRITGTYEIPCRCLIPRGIENLLFAGRPISATHEAHASLRIMNTCCALGEAAGTASALACGSGLGLRELDGAKLKKMLLGPLLESAGESPYTHRGADPLRVPSFHESVER